ncbi:MAG TPA: MG2 domain-containing protein [Gammaproteobacteria bacterium]
MRARATYVAWCWAAVVVLLAVSGCQRNEPLTEGAVDAWERVLSSHTSGIVSRKAEIRVLFATDVATAGGAAAGVLSVQPPVIGDSVFRTPRELVLTSAYDLQPGREYRVTIDPARLTGIRADVEPYTFTFRVQIPQFDVVVQQLESDPADDRRMMLRGTIVTADVEDAAAVERILRARFDNAPLAAAWGHAGNGRDHYFTLTGIDQQLAARDLALLFDGEPIASTRNEERRVLVPARDRFLVTSAQAVEDGDRKEVRVWFSESLDTGQDLQGLVRLSTGGFTTRLSGNILTIYPAADVVGDVTVTLEPGIRNVRGRRLDAAAVQTLKFSSEKPQLRFVGGGVILPDGKTLTVPFEAVNARSVRVVATRVFPDNLPQFLQVNALAGMNDLGRVGRHLWRKTLPLGGPVTGTWQRYEIDVTELVSRYPGSLFHLSLQLTPADSAYPCADDGEARAQLAEPELRNQENGDTATPSAWDFAQDWFGVTADENGVYDYAAQWRDRENPCKPAYYRFAPAVHAQRNVLASNIGLLAKSDRHGRLFVSVSDLRTAEAKANVALSVRNYQNQVLAVAMSDADGVAAIETSGTPFLLVADDGAQRGYLKLSAGTVLPTSHLDVGGENVDAGLKGFVYGERGVWRPGDPMSLTFVVYDRDKTLPADHPATLELADPRGRVTQTVVNAAPLDGFYRFDVATAPDAPTGDWTAKVMLGGVSFKKTLKVETVMPNRLKIELDVGERTLVPREATSGSVHSEWLSGASAAGLKTDVSVRLASAPTRFDRFAGYAFDDPAREFRSEPEELFAGELGADGTVRFEKAVRVGAEPPGMLRADFTTRVFERGGAFSISHASRPLAPYSRFVGVRLPKGDVARGMLRTGEDHVVEIGVLSAQGEPVSGAKLEVTVHKLEWRWWWDRSEDSLAQYIARNASTRLREAKVETDAEGRAQWTLRMDEPEWGRYLVRVCDVEGGHCTGSTFYIDWPYWAGREREQSGPAASMLSMTADKASYEVGDTATVQLPEVSTGRALVTVENGTGILDARWVTPTQGNTQIEIPITAAMTPNAYVAVTLVQPHEGKSNDRPIRLYGAIPLLVEDPATELTPVLETESTWRPESTAWVDVREAHGKPMTYTLAVVDEGLLSLTSFRTPDLHREFFKREALGVRTWDLYDDVIGAYGADLERLLALGGSDAGQPQVERRESRFPPVAQVLGPFRLEAGATARREITLPRYVGAVRVMVVAGDSRAKPGAFGSAEKSVYVRQPLMILPTMTRVIGPTEEITVPISVFAMDESVRDVVVDIDPDGMFEVVGERTARVAFTSEGEKIAQLKLRAAARLGPSRVKFTAVSGEHRAQAEIDIEVRSSNAPTSRLQSKLIAPGETWTTRIVPHGMAGTNRVTLEVSALPPLDLGNRMSYLIQYPHGCLEQTTSAVFPQMFLSSLVELDTAREREIESNVRSGIERLRLFQVASGGFTYWPGGTELANGSLHGYAMWATTWASHFLIEAERLGYSVPQSMRAGVIRSLRASAQSWTGQGGSAMDQAYRLFVLARAGEPEIGAMNRLREQPALGEVERWTLAAAYELAGLRDAAAALAKGNALAVRDYGGADYTFGSALRDHGLVLQAMATLDELDRAEPLVRSISDELGSGEWYSTQAVAYSLLAMSQLASARSAEPLTFEQTLGTAVRRVTSTATVHQAELFGVPQDGRDFTLRNTSGKPMFATVSVRGIPAVQEEGESADGLALQVRYSNDHGEPIDVARLVQGTDVVADLEVRNASTVAIDNIALTQIVPAGWEIYNERLAGDADAAAGERTQSRARPFDSYAATAPRVDYLDIRDDRVLRYFSLRPGESIRFQTRMNAAYRGRYYLPGVVAEAMYDARKHANAAGFWTEVVAQ